MQTPFSILQGKIAAQCAHAAVGVVEEHKVHAAEIFQAWELKGHAKVALRVPTEQEMVSTSSIASLCYCVLSSVVAPE